MRLHAQASVVALVTLSSTLWSRPAAAQAANPPLFSPPTGQNLRDRPDQPADIGFGMLVEGGEGVYYFKGKRVGAEELVPLLSAALTARMAEKVVDFIADASVPYSRILAARDVAAASGACAVALIAQRLPGTRSMLLDDQSPRAGFSRTAIDVQLLDQTVPPPRLNANVNSIVLEVMPGSSYRINTVAVTAANLPTRLRGLYDPRPVKVLLIKGDSAVTYQEVLRAMDVARGAGVIIIGLLGKDLKVPTSLPDIDLSFTRTMPEALPLATSGRCRHPGDDPAGSRAVAGGVPSDALPYFEFQVEKAAKQIPGTGAVKYPDALRPSGMQGQVLVQFVVDAEGKGEPDSFKIIKTSHALFSEAAHAAFLEMRFTPAMVRGKAVRQVVQQPFTFSTAP